MTTKNNLPGGIALVKAPHAAGEAAHTPTPWRLSFPDENSPRDVRGAEGEIIATCSRQRNVIGCASHGPRTAEANAAYIVRACNSHAALVAALENIVAITREGAGDNPPGANDGARLVIIRNRARAALAAHNEATP